MNKARLLESVNAALGAVTSKDLVPQSSCIAIRDGYLWAYNHDLLCRVESGISPLVDAAVNGKKLGDIVSRLPDTEVEIEDTEAELILKSGRRRAGLQKEEEILLPVDEIEMPKEWHELSSEFGHALSKVAQWAVKSDASADPDLVMQCVHITPRVLEASNRFQATRYKLPDPLPFNDNFLIKRKGALHISKQVTEEIAESDQFLFFRREGAVFGVRKYADNFPKMGDIFRMKKPSKFTLPSDLVQSLGMADVFSREQKTNNIQIELTRGLVTLRGEGITGWYNEEIECAYDGDPIRFSIAPNVLQLIAEHGESTETEKGRVRFTDGNWTFLTVTGVIDD